MTDMTGTALIDGINDSHGGFGDEFFNFRCQKEQTKPRAQPWKSHWPAEKQALEGHHQYLSNEDGAALVDGLSNPGDGCFFDLCCQKEQAEPRAQPWKAHWSAEKHAVDAGRFQYLSDENGAALVDGGSGGHIGDGDGYFFDLCS